MWLDTRAQKRRRGHDKGGERASGQERESGQYMPRLYYIGRWARAPACARIPGGRLLFPRSYLRPALFGDTSVTEFSGRDDARMHDQMQHIATEAYALRAGASLFRQTELVVLINACLNMEKAIYNHWHLHIKQIYFLSI